MRHKLIFWIFALFLLVQGVLGVPPFQTASGVSNSLFIETTIFEVVPVAQNYTFYFHVFNQNVTKLTNATTSCFMHIYDFQTGSHLLEKSAKMDGNNIDFEVEINDSVLKKEGVFFRIIQCNNSNTGAFLGTQFKVGYSMREGSVQDAIINSVILLMLVIFFLVSIVWAYSIDGENKFTMGPEGEPFLELNSGKYIKLFLYLLSYMFFWMLTWSTWQISSKFMLSNTFTGIMKILFIIENVLWIPLIIMIVVVGLVKHIADSEVSRLAKRGLRPR